jgi:protein required for attachment to host cells
MLVPHGAHILAVDGGRMQILVNRGQELAPDLEVLVDTAQVNPASHVMEADAPGRTFESATSGGSSHDAADLHQRREDKFIEAAGERLEKLVGKEGALIVIAPPKALGLLRQSLSPAMAKRIVGEIHKDIAHRPAEEIAMLLKAHRE